MRDASDSRENDHPFVSMLPAGERSQVDQAWEPYLQEAVFEDRETRCEPNMA